MKSILLLSGILSLGVALVACETGDSKDDGDDTGRSFDDGGSDGGSDGHRCYCDGNW